MLYAAIPLLCGLGTAHSANRCLSSFCWRRCCYLLPDIFLRPTRVHCRTMNRSNLLPVDAETEGRHTASGRDDVTSSQRRHGPRDVADHVAGIVRQCRAWTTKLSERTDEQEDSVSQQATPASTTLSVTSPATSPTSGAPLSRPPPSPRPSLTISTRPGDPRSTPLATTTAAESPTVCFFTSTNSSSEDVVLVAGDTAGTVAVAGSDSSSGRGSASPDTRSSSRGKSRFKKMLRPLRRTRSAGCSEDFLRKFDDTSHKTTVVKQVSQPVYTLRPQKVNPQIYCNNKRILYNLYKIEHNFANTKRHLL